MAKKKGGKKKAPKPRYRVNGSGKRVPRRRVARAQVLPGLEQVRDSILDRLCEDMGESLDNAAQEASDQKGFKQSALKRMTDKGLHAYQHAGTRFTVTEGSASITAKRVKDDGDSAVTDVNLGDEGTRETLANA